MYIQNKKLELILLVGWIGRSVYGVLLGAALPFIPVSASILPISILIADIVFAFMSWRVQRMELALRVKELVQLILSKTLAGKVELEGSFQYHVLRDGEWCWLPRNLLVPGDVFRDYSLLNSGFATPLNENLWQVHSAPLEEFIRKEASNQSPTLPSRQLLLHLRLLITCFLSISFTIGILLNIDLQVLFSIMFPISLCTLPLPSNFMLLYNNARLHLLLELLSRSLTPFDEGQEIDEFDDEAPPPTKDIRLSSRLVMYKMLDQLVRPSNSLFWGFDCVFALGIASYLVVLDKKHILTQVSQPVLCLLSCLFIFRHINFRTRLWSPLSNWTTKANLKVFLQAFA